MTNTSSMGVTAPRRRGRRVAAAALIGALAASPFLGALGAPPPTASALPGDTGTVSAGPNYDQGDGFLGAFTHGNWRVWCIEPGVDPTPARDYYSGHYSSLGWRDHNHFASFDGGGISQINVLRANAAMYEHRHTDSRDHAAAVQLYVWSKIAPRTMMNFAGRGSTRDAAVWFSYRGNPGAIMAHYDYLESNEGKWQMPPNPANAGSIDLTALDGGRTGQARVNLTGPFAGATVTVKLSNGMFDMNGNGIHDAGDVSEASFTNGQTRPIVAKDNVANTITATAVATSPDAYYQPVMEVFHNTVNGQRAQATGSGNPPERLRKPLAAATPMNLNPVVHPVVSTRVTAETQYVRAGETISDDWTVSMPQGETWPAGAEFTVEGVLYGPFKTKPDPQEQPPADAPVFQTFEGQVVTADSPTVRVTSNPVPEGDAGQGWYTFVATIDASSQNDTAKRWLADDYRFSDTFGLVEETSIRVADVSTRAQASTPAHGDATDTAIVNGAIPENTDLVFELWDNAGTPGDTSDDTSLGITDPVEVPTGFYENAEFVSPPVNVGNPFAGMTSNEARAEYDARHSTYWVETLRINGQPFHVGERELPGETTDVPHVNVTTRAQAAGMYQDYATDTAIVNGTMPVGAMLEFELFLQDDEGGDRSLGITERVPVSEGAYDAHEIVSERLKLTEPGTTYWVERVWVGDELIHEGAPRLPNETTNSVAPVVTTQARPEGIVYEEFTDTARIEGLIVEGTTLQFTAYQRVEPGQPKVDTEGKLVLDEFGEPVLWTEEDVAEIPDGAMCVAQTIASLPAVPVAAGTYSAQQPLLIESAPITTELAADVFWVESLYAPDGSLVHRGECGIPNETTKVERPSVTTQADPESSVHGPFADTASVTGPVPPGATITFEAFQRVEVGSQKVAWGGEARWESNGTPMVWTEDEVAELIDAGRVCEAQPIAELDAVEVPAGYYDRDGVAAYEIVSSSITTEVAGDVFWVETLRNSQGVVLHRGECGIPNETTRVGAPDVRTEATPEVPLGESARDTAIVNGPVPEGAYLKFEAFFIPDGYDVSVNEPGPVATPLPTDPGETPGATDPAETPGEEPGEEPGETPGETPGEEPGEEPVDESIVDLRESTAACIDAERVFAPDQQVPVAAGVNEEARYESAEFTPDRLGTYYWVETLYAPDGSIIHRGECGAPGETTIVVEPPAGGGGGLTVTGGGALWPILLIGGGLLAAAGAAFVVKRRLDAKHAADADVEAEAGAETGAEVEAADTADATETAPEPAADAPDTGADADTPTGGDA